MKQNIITAEIQKLVKAKARKIAFYFNCKDYADDLAQEAYTALLQAGKSFNPEQGTFENYAYPVATHAMYRALREFKQGQFVSLDERSSSDVNDYETFGYDSDEAPEFVDTNPTPSERYEKADMLAKVRGMVETLPENDYNLISKRYGFDNLYERGYSQLAEEMDLSVEGVRKNEKRVLNTLHVKLSRPEYGLWAA